MPLPKPPRAAGPLPPLESSAPPAKAPGGGSAPGGATKRRLPAPTPAPKEEVAPGGLTAAEVAEGWTVDSKTGVKYKKLFENDPALVEAHAKGRMTSNASIFSLMSNHTPQLDDFDADDLTSAADRFLAHLRVPPDREEIARLREERARRRRQEEEVYAQEVEALEAADEARLAALDEQATKRELKAKKRRK